MREDKEFREFRDLMPRPDRFEEGFSWRTVIMALFVGLLMTPAQIYMQLVAGHEMGPAAQWVTVILYVEVSRRAFTKLKRPEIFVLGGKQTRMAQPPAYRFVCVEKPPLGDPWPLDQASKARLMRSWRATPGIRVLRDSDVLFLAEGTFTETAD